MENFPDSFIRHDVLHRNRHRRFAVIVGLAGFWPGVVGGFLTWFYVLLTGILYAEAAIANPDGANVATISRNFLGKTGMIIASTSLAYVHFFILTAYFLFGVSLFFKIVENTFGYALPIWIPYIALLIICGSIVYKGVGWCVYFNLFLGACLLGFMAYAVILGSDHVSSIYLSRTNWLYILFAIPSLYNAFYFQGIIPSLATFIKRDWKGLKIAIWIGTTGALVFFLAWIWLTIGLTSDYTIARAFETDKPLVSGIEILNQTPYIGNATLWVSFFAILASIFAAALTLVDFYFDLFGVSVEERHGKKRVAICYLVFLPPFFISLISSQDIMILVNTTVGLAQLLISGAIPLAWILSARYYKKLEYPNRLKIGSSTLIFLIFLTVIFFYLEGIQLVRIAPS